MSNLLWLPDATRDPHPRSFPWAETTDPKGCLHSTEGSSWPTYAGWTIMPHATVMPHPGKGVEVRQHLPFSQASFALRHTRSQPTNGDYVFQFELIGTCDPHGPRGAYFWPNADDAVLRDLWHKVIRPLDDAYVIPFRAPVWDAYPGETNRHRMTDAEFDTYSGWHGHEHVPQNTHGDPGDFPWKRLAAIAAADRKDDNVTPADIKAIAAAVWAQEIHRPYFGNDLDAAAVLAEAHRYAIEAGYRGHRPTGNPKPGTPTRALDLANQVADVQQQLADLAKAVAALSPADPPAPPTV
jgi:hypothetical protein